MFVDEAKSYILLVVCVITDHQFVNFWSVIRPTKGSEQCKKKEYVCLAMRKLTSKISHLKSAF